MFISYGIKQTIPNFSMHLSFEVRAFISYQNNYLQLYMQLLTMENTFFTTRQQYRY